MGSEEKSINTLENHIELLLGLPYHYLENPAELEALRQALIEAVAVVEGIQYKNRLKTMPDVG